MNPTLKSLLRRVYPLYRPVLTAAGSLDAMARIHGTDKSTHGYTKHYREHFGPLRFAPVRILEIGVGGQESDRVGGESLRMWRDFFPRAEIFAFDLYDKTRFQGGRIRIFQGDQGDPKFLDDFGTKYGPFDIIVDDGSHMSEHVIASFKALFRFVKPGGHYVVEDLSCSYAPWMGGSSEEMNSPSTSMGMLKGLVDLMHHNYIAGLESPGVGDQITGICFYPKVCFIRKGDNSADDPQWRQFAADNAEKPSQAAVH